MKNRLTILAMFLTMSAAVFGQGSIDLTFTADNNGMYVVMDSIYVKNLTQGDAITLYPPDTTLVLLITGIENPDPAFSDNFKVFQNNPNPFYDQTSIGIFIPSDDQVSVEVSNLAGCRIAWLQMKLSKGVHRFVFIAGSEMIYLLKATYAGTSESIKMVSVDHAKAGRCRLSYSGQAEGSGIQKSAAFSGQLNFAIGDELMVVGYHNGAESGFADMPEESRSFTVQFATNVSCPGIDSLLYADQWYHTIQVFGQCWMKENLNAGMMINGTELPSNNGFIEKYCYSNNENICLTEGALYLWNELMGYSTTQGVQGICPPGWHVPTDNECKVLEGAADSFYKIGATIWNATGSRGMDAGKNLKSTYGWTQNMNGVDLYGFRVLPTGYWYNFFFSDRTEGGGFFTSTVNGQQLPYYRGLVAPSNSIIRTTYDGEIGFPLRCIKDM